jgi:hypothetical protein
LLEVQDRATEVLDKLRSALDYCAHELYEQCNATPPYATKVYFPIAPRGSKKIDFRGIVGKYIPGLIGARPDLVALLESYQEFADSKKNSWLPDLATLTNENKHDQFARNRVAEGGIALPNVLCNMPGDGGEPEYGCRQLIVSPGSRFDLIDRTTFGCGQLVINPGGSFNLAEGTHLRADGITIRGPRTILGEPPYLDPLGPEQPQMQAFVFLNLTFALNGLPVQTFLWDAILATEGIVAELSAKA